MKKELTCKERFRRIYNHQEPDRLPILDSPWDGTIRRWEREGMPAGTDWRTYFDTDIILNIGVDTSPRMPRRTVEETDDYRIETTSWGVTKKSFKTKDSTPECLDFAIKTRADWERIKPQFAPEDDRIPWKRIEETCAKAEREQIWLTAGLWFGFDITHSHFLGTEQVLLMMLDDPEWLQDVFETELALNLALYDRIWEKGYRFDAIQWPDDMGYKGTTFFSPAMYRTLLKPYHQRACDWAHARGVKVELHSCGNIMPFMDDLVEIGVDCLNPIEVKAGMDPVYLKRTYGDTLSLRGGINAVLWDNTEAILAEIERLVPVLMENGGYIFSSDHSIPNSVSLENFRAIVQKIKEIGTY